MRALARQRPLVVAHGALLFAALIYSGYNVLLARSLKHLSPVTFSLCRELVAIPLLYLWAARAVVAGVVWSLPPGGKTAARARAGGAGPIPGGPGRVALHGRVRPHPGPLPALLRDGREPHVRDGRGPPRRRGDRAFRRAVRENGSANGPQMDVPER